MKLLTQKTRPLPNLKLARIEKKKAVKPSTRNYDPHPKKAVNNANLVSQFRSLLINTVPSAVGLHILPDHGLNEATEAIDEITEQTSTNGVPLTCIHGNQCRSKGDITGVARERRRRELLGGSKF